MGGVNSYLIGCCGSTNICPENHSKLKISHSNRSFTFNKLNDNIINDDLMFNSFSETEYGIININNASENLLMTLPGVNREIAHDIVLYRSHINGFQNLEDLALVNGIGAAKLELILSEITIGEHKKDKEFKILINEFDIFQMTKVRGLNQALAERIIRHRIKKGPFTSVNDIMRVRSMSRTLLESLEPHIDLSFDSRTSSGDTDSDDVLSLGNKYNEIQGLPIELIKC